MTFFQRYVFRYSYGVCCDSILCINLEYFCYKDVAMCMYAFHIFKLKSQEMEDLEQGLIFHLDNMAIDEVFFIATLENSGLPALLDLVQKFAKRGILNSVLFMILQMGM